MVLRRFSQTFKICLALMLSVLSTGILQVAPVYATDTQSITAKALIEHECDSTEWHFIINQIDDEEDAPASITVQWANDSSETVTLGELTPGGAAHYTTMSNLTSTVTSATASIYVGWSGQFNLSHGPCTSTTTEVTPAAVTFDDKCGTDNDTYTIPAKTGVIYKIGDETKTADTYAAPLGPITITAHPASDEYTLTGQTSFEKTFTNEACPVDDQETTAAVTFDERCGVSDDMFTVTAAEGVTYKLTGTDTVLLPGTNYQGAGTVSITAEVADGYTLTNDNNVFANTFTNEACPDSESVTLCHATGSETKPFVRITVSAAGAFNGHLDDNFGGTHGDHQNGEDIIPTFVYSGNTYSQNWTDGDVLPENCTEPEEITLGEPNFYDLCGEERDVIYLPQTEGVIFRVNGEATTEDWLNAPSATVTVTAETEEGYVFAADTTTSWSYTFTDEDCVSITKTALTPTDTNGDGTIGVGDIITWEITVTNNGDLFFERFNVQVTDIGATLENDGYIDNLAPGESATLKAFTTITAANISTVCKVQNMASFSARYSPIDILRESSRSLLDEQESEYDFTGTANAEVTFACPTPGRVLGESTGGGQGGGHVLATSTALPAMLPATGAKDSPYMILVAALIAYGATYFLQGRRKLLRNQA